jgi:Spy/CpxP family protein refolding chaperone
MQFFKVIQAILLVCSLAQTCACQPPMQGHGNPTTDGEVTVEDHIERQVNDLTKMLNLSSQQRDQVRGVIKSYKPMGDVSREQWRKMTSDERRKIEMASYADRKNKIEAVLTPEQKEKYERELADRRARVGAFITTQPAP